MTALSHVPDAPDPEWVFKRRVSLMQATRELWGARLLVWSLAERNLRARYAQALLGFAWAIISPLALLVAITVLFDKVGDVDTGGAPPILFNYVGLIGWTFFATTMSNASTVIINNLALINKISCPREVFPLSAVAMSIVDTALSLSALAVLFAVVGYAPSAMSIWIPVIFLVQFVFVIGSAILVSVLTVYFRDLRNALPLVIQLGLFATPVAYGLDIIPANIRWWYCLYPLAPVIDAYRRTILFGQAPQWDLMLPGAIGAVLTLVGGFWLFKKMEVRIADVA
jgi:ABC-type polysaccharide/polyol phosphate export permease